MIVNKDKASRDIGLIRGTMRFIRRRFASLGKPVDTEFVAEYRKFRKDKRSYVLHGEQYLDNFRKTLGMARPHRASFMGTLILRYNKRIEGLRVLNGKITYNGSTIFDGKKGFNFDTKIMENFLDFCFFYLYKQVEAQELEESHKNKWRLK